MIPAELPEWARTAIEKYFFGHEQKTFSNIVFVYQWWHVNVVDGNGVLTNTIFAVVKRYSGSQVYCFRITEESFEVSNILEF